MNVLALFSGVNAPKSDRIIAAFWLTLSNPESEHVPKYFLPLALKRASSPVPAGILAVVVVLVVTGVDVVTGAVVIGVLVGVEPGLVLT